MQVEVLADADAARAYYDARYRTGYMDRWEAERQDRLRAVLRDVVLPARPRILDYGCGSGALTCLLAALWPDADVVGADISATAVEHANARHGRERLHFEVLDDAFVARHAGRFHFVFSHHVLEHVFDLGSSVRDAARLLAPGARALHVLPCGNAGSLAHWLCRQRPDGIDAQRGGRFFFEEASHLRRLRSDELAAAFAAHGVRLERARFAYHWLGAARLFTEGSPLELVRLLDPRAWRPRRWPLWCMLAAALWCVWCLRAPSQLLTRTRRLAHQVRLGTRRLGELRSLCLLALAVPTALLWPATFWAEWLMRWLDRREASGRAADPRGSEMQLEFVAPEAAATARHDGTPAATAAELVAAP